MRLKIKLVAWKIAVIVAVALTSCQGTAPSTALDATTTSTQADSPSSADGPEEYRPSVTILFLREGDLFVVREGVESRLTGSGGFLHGLWTRDENVVAVQRQGDEVALVLVDGVTGEVLRPLAALDPLNVFPWASTEFTLSPDGGRLLFGSPLEGFQVIEIPGAAVIYSLPKSNQCCATWSPDGSRIAYLALPSGEKWAPWSNYDLWVADIASGTSPQQLASDLMRWRDPYGRGIWGPGWSQDGTQILVLAAETATIVVRTERGAELRARMNNRLVAVDAMSGQQRELADSAGMRERLTQLGLDPLDPLVISAGRSARERDSVAFLVMDYGRAYGVGFVGSAGGRSDLTPIEVEGGRMVRMGAPLWSPDGTKLAFFGWHASPKFAGFIEVFDLKTRQLLRVWESGAYRKPVHWDWAPDGNSIWVLASRKRNVSFIVSVEQTGVVERVDGQVMDWCCPR